MLGKYESEYYAYILDGTRPMPEPSAKAKMAVFEIIRDLTDRGGLQNEFEAIDDDIQEEIVDEWLRIVKETHK